MKITMPKLIFVLTVILAGNSLQAKSSLFITNMYTKPVIVHVNAHGVCIADRNKDFKIDAKKTLTHSLGFCKIDSISAKIDGVIQKKEEYTSTATGKFFVTIDSNGKADIHLLSEDEQKKIKENVKKIEKGMGYLTKKSKKDVETIASALDPLITEFPQVSRVALIYMDRFNKAKPNFFTEKNVPYYFVTAWNIAQKYLLDESFWTADIVAEAKDRELLPLPEPVNPLNSSIKFSFNDAESFFLNTINWDTAIKESNL